MAGLGASDRFTITAYQSRPGMTLPPRVEVRLVRNRLIASVRKKNGPSIGTLRWEACLSYLEDSWWDAPNPSARAGWQRRSWWLKVSPRYVDHLASEIVTLLRDGFGAVHPSLLGVGADIWDTSPAGPDTDGSFGDLPALPPDTRHLAHRPSGHEHLMRVVLATLARGSGRGPSRTRTGTSRCAESSP